MAGGAGPVRRTDIAMSHHNAFAEPLDLGEFRPVGEGLNFLTHALGLLLSLAAAGELMRAVWDSPDRPLVVGCAAYGGSLIVVYAASTLSHAFHRPRLRHLFRTLDQVCIFFLIAGSYTPWGLAYFREPLGLALLATIWALAICGALFKLFVKGLDNVATAGYVLLGWLPLVAIKQILERLPAGAMAWMMAGGVLYTLGTWFLNRDLRFPYYHAVWHLMVIAASACHFAGVMLYVVPTREPAPLAIAVRDRPPVLVRRAAVGYPGSSPSPYSARLSANLYEHGDERCDAADR
jgi:hemolysin III